MTKPVSDLLTRTIASLVSIGKLLLQSRHASIGSVTPKGDRLIILANGPSLNQTIAEHLDSLKGLATMAVNFAANAPVFAELRPDYYVLIDPLFFSGQDLPNLNALWSNLAQVDWQMTLIVPVGCTDKIPSEARTNANLSIATVNAIGIEGWQWLTHLAYSNGWGMPRPRNVLIPAIMAAVQMGYKEIYLTGADHSWLKTISVNDANEVISIQPHFYKEDDREVKRINTEYLKYPLHQILESFKVAFRSYHQIQEYARSRGIHIYNSTPGSFIDAFDRRPFPDAPTI